MWEQRNYYILVAAAVDKARLSEPSVYKVAVHRLLLRKWGLREHTRNRTKFAPGDFILAYASGDREHGRHFVGQAEVVSSCKPVTKAISDVVDSPTNRALVSEYYLELADCRIYHKPESVKRLKDRLEFIPDSMKWGVVMQNGTIRISKRDFCLVGSRSEGSDSAG